MTSAAGMEFRILGPLEVVVDGAVVSPGGSTTKALLALFLIHPNQIISPDRIIEALWPDNEPTGTLKALRFHIWKLRTALEPDRSKGGEGRILLTKAPGYLLQVEPEQLDAVRFERAVQNARARLLQDPEAASSALTEALGWWRGEPLADLPYTHFAQGEIRRLEELRMAALEARLEADLALGRDEDLVGELEHLVAEHPFRERLRAQLMIALYRAGRQAEALEVYQAARRLLAEELGVEPGSELQMLEERILLQDASLMRSPRQPQPDEPERRHNLPARLTSFVGRSRELDELDELLAANRLITLTGVGGSGKTRLALEAAGRRVPSYAHGVRFVDLTPITDPELVEEAVALSVGLESQQGLSVISRRAGPSLTEFLEDKEMLLVLDNCEQVVDGAAAAAERLLVTSPGLSILATSRTTLGVEGELIWHVPSLDLPDETLAWEQLVANDAVQLFAERAGAALTGFELDQTTGAQVAEICRKLDGLPLAIELAASRVRTVGLEEVTARLQDRFALLEAGPRTAHPRHQALKATVDWSYELLPPPARLLFDRLSVFRGGFSLEAAEQVCTVQGIESHEVLHLLSGLVDHSMVVADGAKSGPRRYRLLETLRQYAAQRLQGRGEVDRLAHRHADHFLSLAETAERDRKGRDHQAWLSRLEEERDNLRASLDWLIGKPEWEEAARLAAALSWFWEIKGPVSEGREWLEKISPVENDLGKGLRCRVLLAAASLAVLDGDEIAEVFASQALQISEELGDDNSAGDALLILAEGALLGSSGSWAKAGNYAQEALQRYRGSGDRWRAGNALRFLGEEAIWEGDYQTALEHLDRADAEQADMGSPYDRAVLASLRTWIYRNLGNLDLAEQAGEDALTTLRTMGASRSVAHALYQLAGVRVDRDELDRADANYREAMEFAEDLADRFTVATVLCSWGWLARKNGDLLNAAERMLQSLQLYESLGVHGSVAWVLESLGGVVVDLGDASLGARLLGAAAQQRQILGADMPEWDRARYEVDVETIRTTLGDDAFSDEWAAGRAMTREQAIAAALGWMSQV